MKKSLSAVSFALVIWTLVASPIIWADSKLGELQELADKVLADTDNVRASKAVAAVFNFAKAVEKAGQTKIGLRYFERGLELAPWRLDEQLSYAGLLQADGQTNAAAERAKLVFDRAETDGLLARSATMLNLPFSIKLPDDSVSEESPSLSLVPLGEVDAWLIRTLQTNLAVKLKIPVTIKKSPMTVPPPKRDHLKQMADRCRKPLEQFRYASEAAQTARRLGLPSSFKDDNEAVISVFREILKKEMEKSDPGAALRFDEELAITRKLAKQWDSDGLLKELARATPSASRPGVAFLAITRLDLFAGESRYVFGFGDSANSGAIMSYLRFTASLIDQPQNKDRLAARALKQALSSVGFAFGVQRCSSPTCARSYPNNLEEHDAKGADLCVTCQNGFKAALGKK